MDNVLLIYETIPEATTIASLTLADLEAAKLSVDDLKSVAGMIVNSDELSNAQHVIMNKISDALADGSYDTIPCGVWADRIVDHLKPIELGGPRLVIWCGFAL